MELVRGHIFFSQKKGDSKNIRQLSRGGHLILAVVSHFAAAFSKSFTEGCRGAFLPL